MKRYIRNSADDIKFRFDIIIILNSQYADIATADSILKYRNIPREYKLSGKEFDAYAGFIKSALSVINKHGFTVIEEYQSNKSYSYYIQFSQERFVGIEDPLEFDVKFSLSDYYIERSNVRIDDEKDSIVRPHIFHLIVVENICHDNIISALDHISKICTDLRKGYNFINDET